MLIQIHEPGQTPLPHEGENEIAIGIDLGTTNSLCAISADEKPSVISDKYGKFIIPSVLNINERNIISVGEKTSSTIASVSSVKRLIGKSFQDVKSENLLPYGIEIIKEKSDKIINFKLGDKEFSPITASAEILKAVKNHADEVLGRHIHKVVITVPAYFNDAQRQATKDAAKLAGLEVIRLINEPTAAALAYGLDKQSEGLYAVYDFGGGTFDVSILQMQMGVFRVIATGGDTHLGGDDIDLAIGAWGLGVGKINSSNNNQQLKTILKKAKEELSENDKTIIEIEGRGVEITRSQFEEIIKPIVDKTIAIFSATLKDARIKPSELEGVIMVGGSTRIPLVRNEIEKLTKKKPLIDINPDQVVALGAAIQAEALTKGSNSLLLDVTPLSLGLETYGGLMEVLISRNTPIPARVKQKFTTYEDGQTAMKIHVLQGERELAKNCRSLACFDLKNIPPQPAGTAVVEVTLALDADGILSVSAIEEKTGTKAEIEVRPSYGLNYEEMEKMLLASIMEAEKDIHERLLVEARIEADIVIKTIKSALAEDENLIDKNYKITIENCIKELQEACIGNDRELIHSLIANLDKTATDFADARVSKALQGYLGGKKVGEVG
ncbi:MAG: Fe-S protein assembly chaperone HscA [Rickettsiales bacterium]|nr:Fe-S protein assembly chaperone HscA [Rickettsiales bacterium]